MRRLLPLASPLIFVACSPVRQPATEAPQTTPLPQAPVAASAAPSLSDDAPVAVPSFSNRTIGGIIFDGVDFDSRTHRLRVVDQTGGPGSQFATAADAAAATGGIAAINGGFFTPDGAPLGLVLSAGQPSGSWNAGSSLGSGLWLENHIGSPSIRRREAVGLKSALRSQELLQAGPMLVEGGRAIGGLEATKASARSMVLWDGGTRWWIGRSSPCTLASMAKTLAENPPTRWKVFHALNLDGGRSADLWVSGAVSGGPAERRPPWNRPARNFLVLVSRRAVTNSP